MTSGDEERMFFVSAFLCLARDNFLWWGYCGTLKPAPASPRKQRAGEHPDEEDDPDEDAGHGDGEDNFLGHVPRTVEW